MSEMKFRFPDLEKNKASQSTQKKVKNPTPEPVPAKQEESHHISDGITKQDIRDLSDRINQFEDALHRTAIIQSYRSQKYEGIEYIVQHPYVLIHNYQTNAYVFGGQSFTDMELALMMKFVKENYSSYWMCGKIAEDDLFMQDFCAIYTKEIVDMISTLASAQLSIWGDGSCITDTIQSAVQEYSQKFSHNDEEDESELEESVEDDETEDESEEEEEEPANEPEDEEPKRELTRTRSISDDEEIRRQVEQEDAEQRMEEIPALDLGYPDTSNSNLGKYANKINESITDDEMYQMIREARQKKADRRIQLRYTSN